MDNELILSKEEVMNILCIKSTAFKNIIKTNTLSKRFKEKGYKYIERFKEGRVYKYKVIKENSCKEIIMFNSMLINYFGIKSSNCNKFVVYLLYRFSNVNNYITKQIVAEKVGVSRKTIDKWDKIMIENGLITKDYKINYDNIFINNLLKYINENNINTSKYKINNYNSITTNSGVYFILNKSNNLIKIGCANNIQKRFKQIQGQFRHLGLDDNIELVNYIETKDYKKLEKKLHEKYKDKRVNHEWFDISVDEVCTNENK